VILIGPSHRDAFAGISIFGGDGFETPLGVIPIDTEVARRMSESCKGVMLSDMGHRMEHALEVQIPFLQTALPESRIVPVTMGLQDRQTCESFAACMSHVLKDSDAIIIASSDLSHFHAYEDAAKMDARSASYVEAFDPDGFMDALEARSIEACGGGPVAATMMASKQLGATSAKILHTCNSGDISGDRSSVVGYAAALFGRDDS